MTDVVSFLLLIAVLALACGARPLSRNIYKERDGIRYYLDGTIEVTRAEMARRIRKYIADHSSDGAP